MRCLIIFFYLFFIAEICAQVVVRCPNNVFARCVPNEESSLDTWTISPCDCNDIRNVYTSKKVCRRTITLCSNNPTQPADITAFDFPYFALNPITMKEMYGPNLQQLVTFMDASGIIDPNLSADDQDVALLLEIDPNTGCATFDAWVPLGEEHAIQVYTASNETGNEWRYITIPDNTTCNRVIKSCYFFGTGAINAPIPNGNGTSLFSGINVPLDGKLSDIRVNRVDISHSDISDVRLELWSPAGTKISLYDGFACTGSNNLLIGFEQTGPITVPCPPTTEILYQPDMSFQEFLYDPSPKGIWNLRVFDPFNNANFGTLGDWEIQLCLVEDICGPFVTSSDTPTSIPSSPTTIFSDIVIQEKGTIESLSIFNLYINHSSIGSLRITLTSPSGTTRTVSNFQCPGKTELNMRFEDNAMANSIECNAFPFGKAKPEQSFAAFIGEEVMGTWRLAIQDVSSGSGTLNKWSMHICTDCLANYTQSSGNKLTGSVPDTYQYQARNEIQSCQSIIGTPSINTTATYQSGQSISLDQKFEVTNGVVFEAIIDNCHN